MKVICIGNYPPRQCGIATFTENLVNVIRYSAAKTSNHFELEVIAMNDSNQSYDYPPIVRNFIPDKSHDAYTKMADYVNHSGADILLLQHEYGIYGGESGVLLLGLLRRIKIPIVTTLHTVLLRPSFHQKEVLKKITELSSKVVIMNNMAIDFLTEIYGVPKQKIIRIEHGVPDFEANSNQLIAPPEDWNNRKVMLTFGLIGRSKGIETVIKALPDIVTEHPEVLYVVLGKTHPSIVKHAGEEYREYLHDLVHKLKLENNVV
ncbi:MAG: glycosyltransferase, partial [Ignavibacteria bacterium]|nr:glycosyltransferase [Ignavibacteria bacterium]